MLSSFFPFAFNTNILTLDIFIIEIKTVSAELELNYSIGEKRQHIKNLKTYIVIFNSYLKLTKPELFIKFSHCLQEIKVEKSFPCYTTILLQ